MTSPWPPIVRVYRFNAALWAARRYGSKLRDGVARRRGAAMRAADNPCGHKGVDGAICTVCGEVLGPYTPDERYGGWPLAPCDWADMTDYERRDDFDWGNRVWWGQPPPEKPKIA